MPTTPSQTPPAAASTTKPAPSKKPKKKSTKKSPKAAAASHGQPLDSAAAMSAMPTSSDPCLRRCCAKKGWLRNLAMTGIGALDPRGDSGQSSAELAVVPWASLWAMSLVRWRARWLGTGWALFAMLRGKVSMRFSWTFHSRIGRDS